MKFYSTRPPPSLDHKARGTFSFVLSDQSIIKLHHRHCPIVIWQLFVLMSYNIWLFIILITKKWMVSISVCFSFFINKIYKCERTRLNFKMLTLRLVVKIWMFLTLMLNVCLFFVVDYLCFAWTFFKIIYFGC